MSKLEAALSWAERGFYVFPLQEGGKNPLAGSRGHLDATRDPAEIRRMWTDPVFHSERDYNIGCSPRDGKFVIVDLDVKDDRHGPENFLGLGGQIDGLVVRTPSGGYHVYCNAPYDTPNTVGTVASGIDTRGSDGYAVAPGSMIDGRAYEVVLDGDLLPAPQGLLDRLGERASAVVTVSHVYIEDDLPANIERAVRLAKQAAPAVSGCWHDLGYKLGCEMARLAVSQEKAVEILEEWWVPRGVGFKSYDQFVRDVSGGYQDALPQHGINAAHPPSEVFAGVVPPPSETEQACPVEDNPAEDRLMLSRTVAEGVALREVAVPYVVKGLMGPGDIAAVLGGPGCGKSVLLPKLAFCVALGVPFLERKVRQCRVLYFASENGLGLERRLQALADQMGDPGDMLRALPNPFSLSCDSEDLARFKATVEHWQPGMVIIDTLFAGFPGTDLTDRSPEGIPHIVSVSRGVGYFDCAPLLVYGHHTPKTGETAYGGQQIQAMFDTTLFVEGELKADRTITIRKNRMGQDGDRYKFRIEGKTLFVDDEGDAITAPVLQWVDFTSPEQVEKTAQEAWLSDPKNGPHRTTRNALEFLTKEAVAEGRGATPAEMLGDGLLARIDLEALTVRMVELGVIEEPVSVATRDLVASKILNDLKTRGFVDMDSTHVWTLRR